MGYLEEKYLKDWKSSGGVLPAPTETLLTVAGEIAASRGFGDDNCFCIAQCSDGSILMAASGKPVDEVQRLLAQLDATVLPNGIDVENSPGYDGVHPQLFQLAPELSALKQEGLVKVGASGTGLCAEKKILTYCLINKASIKSMAVFAGPNAKFGSYQTVSSSRINYLFPCESCKSAYCAYIDMKLEGDTGYPAQRNVTGNPARLPSTEKMLARGH
jgi:hypothetical protein